MSTVRNAPPVIEVLDVILGVRIEVNYDILPNATPFLQPKEPEECAYLPMEFLEERGFA